MEVQAFARNSEQGVVALISVIIIGTIGVAVSVSIILTAIGRSQTAIASERAALARNYASTCADHALNQLRMDQTYLGNESLTMDLGTCDILPITGSDDVLTIKARGTVQNVVQKIQVITATVRPLVTLTSWRDVADFSP